MTLSSYIIVQPAAVCGFLKNVKPSKIAVWLEKQRIYSWRLRELG